LSIEPNRDREGAFVTSRFIRLRELLASHKELARRLDALEQRYDGQFKVVFDAIRKLMSPPEPSVPRIGYHAARQED
jgi:hypothetical protein